MFFLTSVAFFSFLLGSCSNTPQDSKKDTGSQQKFILVEKGSQSGIKTEKQQVITSAEEFANIWKENFSLTVPNPAIPEIDFSKKMVIAIWMGEKNRGGFDVDIQSINIEDEFMVIVIKHIQPGKTCISTMSIEQPFLFALIDKYPVEKTIFQIVNEIKECN